MKLLVFLIVVAIVAVACELQDVAPSIALKTKRINSFEVPQAKVHYSEATGTAHLVTESTLTLKKRSPHSSVEQGLAAFLAAHPEVGIKDPATELFEISRRQDSHIKDWLFVRFGQMHKGIEVHEINFNIIANSNNQILSSSGAIVPDLESLDVIPKVSSETAVKIAMAAVPNNLRTNHFTSKLKIYRTELAVGQPGTNHLIYYITFRHFSGVDHFVIVDAHDGKVLSSYNNVQHSLLREIIQNNSLVYRDFAQDNPPVVPGSSVDLSLHLTQRMYTAMLHIASYNSWDNAGSKFTSVFGIGANFFPGSTCPNAYWLPARNITAYCPEYEDYDSFGHEWGHAYAQEMAGFSSTGLAASLKEFYPDMFGEVFQMTSDIPAFNYPIRTSRTCNLTNPTDRRWISGDSSRVAYINSAGVGTGLRDMWNPNCYSNPSTMTDQFFVCNFSVVGAGHNNVGVPSQVFSLAVDGGEFMGVNYTGIGILKAFHIYIRALPLHAPTSTFMQHADFVNSACNQLAENSVNLVEFNGTASGQIVTKADCSTLAALFTATGMDRPACNQAAANIRFREVIGSADNAPTIISGPYPTLVMNVGQDEVFWHIEDFEDVYCRIEGFDNVYDGEIFEGDHSYHAYCSIPPIDGVGTIQISISEDGSKWFGPYDLIVHEPYTITAYGPTVGPVEGGNTIQIEGEDFFGDATGCNPQRDEEEDCPVCYFGYDGYGVTVPATIESSTSARCTAPSWEGLSVPNRTVEIWLSMNYFIAVGPLPYEYKEGVGPAGDVPLTQSKLSFPPNAAPVASIKKPPPTSVASFNQITLMSAVTLVVGALI